LRFVLLCVAYRSWVNFFAVSCLLTFHPCRSFRCVELKVFISFQEVSDIVERMSSGVWSDRRDGLAAFQTFLKSDGQLRLVFVRNDVTFVRKMKYLELQFMLIFSKSSVRSRFI
jgi:hypothetical protein